MGRHGTAWDGRGWRGMVCQSWGRGWQRRCQGGKSQCPTRFAPVPPSPTHPHSSPCECGRPHPKDTDFEGPVTPVRQDTRTPAGQDVSLALPQSPPARGVPALGHTSHPPPPSPLLWGFSCASAVLQPSPAHRFSQKHFGVGGNGCFVAPSLTSPQGWVCCEPPHPAQRMCPPAPCTAAEPLGRTDLGKEPPNCPISGW